MKLRTLVCLGLIVFAVSFASAQQSPSLPGSLVDWTQFNFDSARDGYNPFETVLNPSNVANVSMKWSYVPTEGPVQGQPAIANGMVYVVAGSTTSGHGAVYAINAQTGAFIWKFMPGLLLGAPALANGLVYVNNGGVTALDANTGAVVWQASDSGGISVTVANNVVYADSFESPGVDALNGSTGKFIWRHALNAYLTSPPAVANGAVYAVAKDGGVYALDVNTGVTLWSRQLGISPTPQATIYSTTGGLSVGNGVVYVEAADAKSRPPRNYNVWALDANTGATIWKSGSIGNVSGFGTTPAVANGTVYVGSSGYVNAFNASTGAPIWQYQPDAGDVGSPVVANGVVYVGWWKLAGFGTGYYTNAALDATTGNVLWNWTDFQGEEDVAATPAVVNGVIYGARIPSGGTGAFSLPN